MGRVPFLPNLRGMLKKWLVNDSKEDQGNYRSFLYLFVKYVEPNNRKNIIFLLRHHFSLGLPNILYPNLCKTAMGSFHGNGEGASLVKSGGFQFQFIICWALLEHHADGNYPLVPFPYLTLHDSSVRIQGLVLPPTKSFSTLYNLDRLALAASVQQIFL